MKPVGSEKNDYDEVLFPCKKNPKFLFLTKENVQKNM